MSNSTQETPNEEPLAKNQQEEFLLKDYELKINYLVNHLDRMWTRFNYFVTIEAALIGGKLLFNDQGTNNLLIVLLGAGISFIWYIMGAGDRFLVRVYQAQVYEASTKVASKFLKDEDSGKYCYVGDIDGTIAARKDSESHKLHNEFSGWRTKHITPTRMAAFIPFFVFIAWVVALISLLFLSSSWFDSTRNINFFNATNATAIIFFKD